MKTPRELYFPRLRPMLAKKYSAHRKDHVVHQIDLHVFEFDLTPAIATVVREPAVLRTSGLHAVSTNKVRNRPRRSLSEWVVLSNLRWFEIKTSTDFRKMQGT